jgi:hypothetical protein
MLRMDFDGPAGPNRNRYTVDDIGPGIDIDYTGPEYGPSTDRDSSAVAMTLEKAGELCTLTVCETLTGPGVRAQFEYLVLGRPRQSEHRWGRVSAFVSAYVSSDARTSENDRWVVKVVFCPRAEHPHVKQVELLFATLWSGTHERHSTDEMRRTFHDWVLQKGFELLLER